MLDLPKIRPALVEEDGGGGFWICDAVGARDWRMEYVRCMVGESCEGLGGWISWWRWYRGRVE